MTAKYSNVYSPEAVNSYDTFKESISVFIAEAELSESISQLQLVTSYGKSDTLAFIVALNDWVTLANPSKHIAAGAGNISASYPFKKTASVRINVSEHP